MPILVQSHPVESHLTDKREVALGVDFPNPAAGVGKKYLALAIDHDPRPRMCLGSDGSKPKRHDPKSADSKNTLNPSYATTHHWYALYLAAMGRLEEAIASMKRAQELDPLVLIVNSNLGRLYYYARRYDQAVEQYRRTLELDPNFTEVHRWLAKAYLQTGKHREALAELSRAVELSATSAVLPADLTHAYGRAGNRQESLRHARELQEFSKTKYVSPYDSARVHLGLGEKDQALSVHLRQQLTRLTGKCNIDVGRQPGRLRIHFHQQRSPSASFQCPVPTLLLFLLHLGIVAAHAARVLDGLDQIFHLDLIGVILDHRFVILQRDLGFLHAFDRFQCGPHCGCAGASGHAGDRQRHRFFFGGHGQAGTHQRRGGQHSQVN